MSKHPQKISAFFKDEPLTGLFSVSGFVASGKQLVKQPTWLFTRFCRKGKDFDFCLKSIRGTPMAMKFNFHKKYEKMDSFTLKLSIFTKFNFFLREPYSGASLKKCPHLQFKALALDGQHSDKQKLTMRVFFLVVKQPFQTAILLHVSSSNKLYFLHQICYSIFLNFKK